MSSLLKKYKENVKKNKLEFDPLMYKNTYGSFGIAYYRCFCLQHSKEENDAMRSQLKDVWKRMKRDKVFLPYLDDPEFVDKMMTAYGITEFPYGNIAIVVGSSNTLFAPCYTDVSGKKLKVQIIPLREDGLLSPTLIYGKAKVIVRDVPQETENTSPDA